MIANYCSDLHLDQTDECFFNLENKEAADLLILAGDIVQFHHAYRYEGFFEDISSKWKHIIYIAGNHEHYGLKINKTYDKITKMLEPFPNVHHLNNQSITIGETLFIASTLWTDCNKSNPTDIFNIHSGMSDYRAIEIFHENKYRKLRPSDTIRLHKESINYIKGQLNNTHLDKVIITHHAPSSLSIVPQYQNSILNNAYYSDLSDLILDSVNLKYWIHGHMHHRFRYQLGDTTVLCNPRGIEFHDDQAELFHIRSFEFK